MRDVLRRYVNEPADQDASCREPLRRFDTLRAGRTRWLSRPAGGGEPCPITRSACRAQGGAGGQGKLSPRCRGICGFPLCGLLDGGRGLRYKLRCIEPRTTLPDAVFAGREPEDKPAVRTLKPGESGSLPYTAAFYPKASRNPLRGKAARLFHGNRPFSPNLSHILFAGRKGVLSRYFSGVRAYHKENEKAV